MSDQNKVGNISVSFGSDPSVTLYNLGRATAKQAAKINTLVHSIFSHDESGKGGVSENTSDPRYNMTVNFASENGISPMLTGIDGTSIYTFAGNTLVGGLKEYITLHPIFYKMDNVDPQIHRPHTIYETFLAVLDWVSDEISKIEVTITGSECITDCAYTKAVIGERAFTPGGALTPGSIMENVDKLLCYVEQIREEAFGETYTFRSYGTGDCTGKSDCSLNEKVDALLVAVGASEYVSGYSSEGCSISIDSVANGSNGCPANYVETFTPANGTNMKIDPAGGVNAITSMDDELIDFDGVAGDTIASFFGSSLEDLFAGGRNADPIAHTPKLYLWDSGLGTDPYGMSSQWVWNPNGAHWHVPTTQPWLNNPWEIDTYRSRIRMNTPFNFNVTWQTDLAQQAIDMVDLQATMDVYWEITLYGNIGDRPNPTSPVAKYSGSFRDLTQLPFTPLYGDGSGIFIGEGPTKLCLLQNITFNDFRWEFGYNADQFEYDPIITNTDPESHLITYATVTLITQPKGSLATALSGIGDRTTIEGNIGQMYLVNAEIEWSDPGCEDLVDPACGGLFTVTLDDQSAPPSVEVFTAWDGESYQFTLDDGSISSSGELAGDCEDAVNELLEEL